MSGAPRASRGIDLRRFRDATDVADWRLCIGCGACVPACGEGRLAMVDRPVDGLRPVHVARVVESELRFFEDMGAAVAGAPAPLRPSRGAHAPAGDAARRPACGDGCTDCLDVCPGIGISHASGPAVAAPSTDREGGMLGLAEGWGPVLEIWEGHATDPAMRAGGSSAGVASVLALHAVEHRGLSGVLHVGSDPQARWRNRTVFSRTHDEMLSRTGSRYAPASPCDGLAAIEGADAPAAFIGKPCDVEGLRLSQAARPALDAKVGLAIGIFCAGTPSTQGTIALLAKHGIAPEDVEELRYRGRGWPGMFAVRLRGQDEWRDLATYAEAWGFLQAYRPHRCYLCPDSTSEFADVACGDPWYQDTAAHQPGLSLVLVRSERGRAAVRAAMDAGVLRLRRVGAEALERSQAELRGKRGAIWGRLLTLRALGVPAPRYAGFPLLRQWLALPFGQQARSIVGTVRRALARGYRRPLSARAAAGASATAQADARADDETEAARRKASGSAHLEPLGAARRGELPGGELVRAAVPAATEPAGHAVAVHREG